MSESFDPYHKWLGISPKDQPAHHYRLLAIDILESDPDVIADAVEQRFAHVRQYQLGKHSGLSQEILNEIAAAKACLLDPKKKAEYDEQLRQRLEAQSHAAATEPIPPPPPHVASVTRVPRSARTAAPRRTKYTSWRPPSLLLWMVLSGFSLVAGGFLCLSLREPGNDKHSSRVGTLPSPTGHVKALGKRAEPSKPQEGGEQSLEKPSAPGVLIPELPVSPLNPDPPDEDPKRTVPDPPSPAVAPSLAVAPFDRAAAKQLQADWADYLGVPVEITNSIGMKLAFVPVGEFNMGSPKSEEDHSDDENQHRVRITKAFRMGMHEVTQAEYKAVMETNPSWFSKVGHGSEEVSDLDSVRFPVDSVSWEEAVEFCRRLSAMEDEQQAGRDYRLPTEAEWEYACRGGTTTAFHFGFELDGRQANCNGNHPYGTRTKAPLLGHTARPGSYQPNAFGLYDMHGNVYEWCADWYDDGYYAKSPEDDPHGPPHGTRRVIRGGSWYNRASLCRSADRMAHSPTDQLSYVGFRVAVEVRSGGVNPKL